MKSIAVYEDTKAELDELLEQRAMNLLKKGASTKTMRELLKKTNLTMNDLIKDLIITYKRYNK